MKIPALLIFLLLIATSDYAQNRAFEKKVKEAAEILRLPGYILAVVKNGKVIERYMAGYSNLEKKIPVHSDALFMIASVTKTMTANLIMQYEQEHKASLDDYVLNYRYVDIGFGWPYNVDPNAKIRHLLSQTSEDGPGNSFVYMALASTICTAFLKRQAGIRPMWMPTS
ncbi:Beta-lactamase [Mucilaginibacter pineti]|uniref:Beta-lactamase n=1 Tax=Mucilaginibacter pineti TaxID=1391627 RepID=A0A1G7NMK0_9SPHI|nr:serine hydrolase domain-containing protein [Mucilaginibacter pineti]SDF75294.1 Beta-lactamase [Mucilaginibacter pineti]